MNRTILILGVCLFSKVVLSQAFISPIDFNPSE